MTQDIVNLPNEQAVAVLLGNILTELRRARVSDDLWTVDDIAAYLKYSRKTVQNRLICANSFPSPIRLPTGDNVGGQKLWKSKEVKAWVEKFKVVPQ